MVNYGESCNSVCSTHGGCVEDGFFNWAGTNGNATNCSLVSSAIVGQQALADGSQWGGCSYHFYGIA